MSALEELVRRYVESGHPYPREAVAFAVGNSEEAAQRLLDELDTPRQPGTWKGANDNGLLTRRNAASPFPVRFEDVA